MSNETMEDWYNATEHRRAIQMYSHEDWYIHEFKYAKFRSPVILPWIRDHTTGTFCIGPLFVGFTNKEDYFMFKLGYPEL